MTNFYIDFVNGLDTNAGTTGATAWQTINKYTNNVRVVGDVCTVRGGMTHPTITTDINFLTDGNRNNHLILKGDNGLVDWGGGANQDQIQLGAGNNTNVIFGSKVVTIVGEDVTATIATSDGLRLAGDTRNYEVKSVSFVTDTIITLYLPYKETTQTNVTSFKIPSKPLIDFGGLFNLLLVGDSFWLIKDFNMRASTDTGGMVALIGSTGTMFEGCVFRDTTSANVNGIKISSGNAMLSFCRFDNNTGFAAIRMSGGSIEMLDVLFDNNLYGIRSAKNLFMENVVFQNSSVADLEGLTGEITGRNIKLLSTSTLVSYTNSINTKISIEDYNGVAGDNRVFTSLDETEGIPSLQSESSILRPGGGVSSIKCIPSSNLTINSSHTKLLLNEWIIDADTSSKIYTVYVNLPTADFTTAPTASELYLEIEYYENASSLERIVELSTSTVLADGNWNTMTITAQPSTAGLVYLKAYYAKTKESIKTNIFYIDTNIGIA